MRLQSPFATVTPTLDGDVLTALARADQWFTVPQLAGVIGKGSPDGIRKVLIRLAAEGLVELMSGGRSRLYRLNRDHLAAPALLELADLRTTLIRRLHDEMSAWTHPPPPVYAALFGSGARGTMTVESDLDLFLLRPDDAGDSWDDDVDSIKEAASRWTGNDVQVLEFAAEEARGNESAEPALQDVIHEGITVLGDRLAFRRLARG
ncbi:nucleotidyltransferase domain-containing protein [Citricoccus zhacaiensis]|nr:nucleotidyltransferase domain-containing protein [Citricoccus zhacaiensis]